MNIDVPINIKHDNTLARPLRDYTPSDRVMCDRYHFSFEAAQEVNDTSGIFRTKILSFFYHDD